MNFTLFLTHLLTSLGFNFEIVIQPNSTYHHNNSENNISVIKPIDVTRNKYSCGISLNRFNEDGKISYGQNQFDKYSIINRIVGGRQAVHGEFPWQVSIQKATRFGFAHFCGGALVTDQWVITAAHCLDWLNSGQISDGKNKLKIVAGIDSLEQNKLKSNERKVKRFILFPSYDAKIAANDIALIQLDSSYNMELSNGVLNTICLPIQEQFFTGKATVSGWGQTDENGSDSVYQLLAVDVPIISDKQCIRSYGREFIRGAMMCAGEMGKDSCQGDSGGALIYRDKSTGRATIVGIVSVGNGCGRQGYPGIYAKVTHYVDWIKKIINS